jgi:hypothetical protein
MLSIAERAGIEFSQALLCVEYRVPKPGILRGPGYLLALSLRYGFIGAAAAFHLMFSTADDNEEQEVLSLAGCWTGRVTEHLLGPMRTKLPIRVDETVAQAVANISIQPVTTTLKLFHYGCPLEEVFCAVHEQIAEDYRTVIRSGAPLFRSKKFDQEFQAISDKSIEFGLHFLDRRQAGLEELPEITLIGE